RWRRVLRGYRISAGGRRLGGVGNVRCRLPAPKNGLQRNRRQPPRRGKVLEAISQLPFPAMRAQATCGFGLQAPASRPGAASRLIPHFSFLVFLAALLWAPPASAQNRPPTGIPALDSLPLHDWGLPDRPLSMPLAIGLATVFPGGGQFYGGHPVRGSFL